jgi:hypothetical protein
LPYPTSTPHDFASVEFKKFPQFIILFIFIVYINP